MRRRQRPRRKRLAVAEESCQRQAADKQAAPHKIGERPRLLQVSARPPVELRFACSGFALRLQRRAARQFTGFALAFVPKDAERLLVKCRLGLVRCGGRLCLPGSFETSFQAQANNEREPARAKFDGKLIRADLHRVTGDQPRLFNRLTIQQRLLCLRQLEEPIAAREFTNSGVRVCHRAVIERQVVARQTPDRQAFAFEHNVFDELVFAFEDEFGSSGHRNHPASMCGIKYLQQVQQQQAQEQGRGCHVRRQPGFQATMQQQQRFHPLQRRRYLDDAQ